MILSNLTQNTLLRMSRPEVLYIPASPMMPGADGGAQHG
jgi:hypothetical protein